MARSAKSSAAMTELRNFGLRYPGAHTKSPWPGHLDLAIKGKTFAFMSTDGEAFSLTCKLPDSGVAALMFPFASAAAYGLGKSGWVNAKFDHGDTPPPEVIQVFKDWIDESYRATAPKKLIAAIASEAPAAAANSGKAAPRKVAKATKAKRKAAPRKAAKAAKAKRKAAPRKAAKATKTKRKAAPKKKTRTRA
ncbi:MAG TPA: MmcQ/YjbR family DNA-binding protein [Polyangiales bacterium]|jgi:hypothetical protein|nr:MmcQ/YjbR family DNA-binding protein [Polyangiales bacterium]